MANAEPDAAAKVERELGLVASLGLQQLREFWKERWGAPPRLRSVPLLRLMIAWRLQEPVYGGLDAETRRLLRGRSTLCWGRPACGTRLTREYRGVLHQVDVRESGFAYGGREYPNLSRIAEEITGTHWNGPRFFGLRSRSLSHE